MKVIVKYTFVGWLVALRRRNQKADYINWGMQQTKASNYRIGSQRKLFAPIPKKMFIEATPLYEDQESLLLPMSSN